MMTSLVLGTCALTMAAETPQTNQANNKAVANSAKEDWTAMLNRQELQLPSDRLTPEVLWCMGRMGSAKPNRAGTHVLYTVSYYSVADNKSISVIYVLDLKNNLAKPLVSAGKKAYSPTWLYHKGQEQIVYLSPTEGTLQLWAMNADGTQARQLSFEKQDVQDFLFSPQGDKVILIQSVEQRTAVQQNDADLPQTTAILANELMYKHWDRFVTTAPHPILANFDGQRVSPEKDLLANEPYEAPMMPFGGKEQLAWSPDGTKVAYTSRKKTGIDYATSTDSDIYLYDLLTETTRNLCKPADWKAPPYDPQRSLQDQPINHLKGDFNVGYDQNPLFSPDGKRIAWSSQARDGYESDRHRICVYELETGKKTYVTEQFQSNADNFLWHSDSRTLYFQGVWHGRTQLYQTNLRGEVKQLTNETADYVLDALLPKGKQLLARRHSMSRADELFVVDIKSGQAQQITTENKVFYDQLTFGQVKERWVKTTDGKEMLVWVIYPPHFDPQKKYPVLLYCQGGPQSAVSQFWSYRWNFQLMAAHDYIIVAPNRRGLPGFGMEWLEQISGDYSGQCMQDYLAAIDDVAKESYVDQERLGAVGASFGGYSVYWLAGNHNKRFKAFIAHDGIYNTQQQYVETEELWFANWDMGCAPWIKDEQGRMAKVFETSPHLYVDRWDTPILCISGQKDYRIEYTQAQSAFTAARLRGVPAQLLLFPDENHWVLRPQNGIMWQRTFFGWLDRWLK